MAVAAFAPHSSRRSVSSLDLFPKKKAAAPAPAAPPAPAKKFGAPVFKSKAAAPAPAPVKKAAAPAPVKKAAPAPATKAAPAPAKKAAAPAPVKKAAPAPVKKAAPAPAKKAAPVRKSSPKTPAFAPTSSSFAYGLVGSDVETGEFDPLQLAAGRSEETVSWYRAAELKVCTFIIIRYFRFAYT